MSNSDDEHRAPHAPTGPRGSWARRRAPSGPGVRQWGATAETVVAAAVAVGVLIVVRFLVAFVDLIGNAVQYQPSYYASGFEESPIGLFLGAVVLDPLPFYIAVFLAATFVYPFARPARLPLVLVRAVAAGGCGTVVLAVVGLATSLPEGTASTVVLDSVFVPLSSGLELTAVLGGGAVLAWLWGGRLDEQARDQQALDERALDAQSLEGERAQELAAEAETAAGLPDEQTVGAPAAGVGVPAPVPGSASAASAPVAVPLFAAPSLDEAPVDAPAPSAHPTPDLSRFAPPEER